jgi:uncharacterized protein (TIGR02646 family)
MIKLTRPSPPLELTESKIRELTMKFKENKTAVWKKKYITEPLLEMSYGKCAYCECVLVEEGKYAQVEHFFPKSLYEDKVVEWENLLPICGRCNISKSDHDTGEYPIIDPTIQNPNNHLEFCLNQFRILGKDEIGDLSEKILDLNDLQGLAIIRFKIWQEMVNELVELGDLIKSYNPEINGLKEKLKVQRKFKKILNHGLPNVYYSATVSTLIVAYPEYSRYKGLMIEKHIWNDELEMLENQVKRVAFEIRVESPFQSFG